MIVEATEPESPDVVEDLGQGDSFFYQGDLYIKTDDRRRDEPICVQLMTGLLHSFPDQTIIKPAHVKVVSA